MKASPWRNLKFNLKLLDDAFFLTAHFTTLADYYARLLRKGQHCCQHLGLSQEVMVCRDIQDLSKVINLATMHRLIMNSITFPTNGDIRQKWAMFSLKDVFSPPPMITTTLKIGKCCSPSETATNVIELWPQNGSIKKKITKNSVVFPVYNCKLTKWYYSLTKKNF